MGLPKHSPTLKIIHIKNNISLWIEQRAVLLNLIEQMSRGGGGERGISLITTSE